MTLPFRERSHTPILDPKKSVICGESSEGTFCEKIRETWSCELLPRQLTLNSSIDVRGNALCGWSFDEAQGCPKLILKEDPYHERGRDLLRL